jgi:phosphoribosyl-ATP pyrophosphohydrolase/phosphoribosyl-AMP cyclohydrolase
MDTDIRWNSQGLVPAIVQDTRTGQVLMLAYMNAVALQRTLESGEAWFWSRSRQALWHKGASSGNTQRVRVIHYDCDADALLVQVEPHGPACHTGQVSCFYRRLPGLLREEPTRAPGEVPDSGDGTDPLPLQGPAQSLPQVQPVGLVLERLWATILERQAHPRTGSYTCRLLAAGEPRILRKIGEEAVETIVAAQSEGNARLVSELADLLYHALVLLAARGLSWAAVLEELAQRES